MTIRNLITGQNILLTEELEYHTLYTYNHACTTMIENDLFQEHLVATDIMYKELNVPFPNSQLTL